MTWEQGTILVGMPIIATAGVMLTLLTLPGTWLIVLGAVALKLWLPGEISWLTIGLMVFVALLAEAIEIAASALGAAKAGASKRGAIASIFGAIVGAVVGSFIFPIIGTIVGGAVGAGAAVLLAEKWLAQRTWKEAGKASGGAAVGRLVATIAKCILAIAIGVIACIAAAA